MNSTTSPKTTVTPIPGDDVYVPFWVLLEFLDTTPPDPFVKGKVVSVGIRRMNSPTGQIQFMACDFEIKPDLIAPGIPTEYLIPEAELRAWADKIADWFRSYPDKQSSTHIS